MERFFRSSLVVVAVWVLLAILVAGGVIIGAHPAPRNLLRAVLPGAVADVLVGESVGFPLQDEVLDRLESTFYQPVDPADLEDDSIRGMLQGLNDDYTNYLDPEQYSLFQERA